MLLAFATLLIQAIVWLGLFGSWAISRPPVVANPSFPPCSLIVCAHNEADNLAQNLPTWLEQDYPKFELLVVDDASTDATAHVLKTLKQDYPDQINLIFLEKKRASGKKSALSAGIAAAQHEHLLLSDADCRPAGRHWMQRMMAQFQPGIELVLGYGPMEHRTGWFNTWIRFETAMTALQYFSFAKTGQAYMGVGRNMACKRTLFDRANGFEKHEHLASGDDDLFVNATAKKNNTALCNHPDAWVFSPAKSDFWSWWTQKNRHLSTAPLYQWQHRLGLATIAGSQVFFHAALLFGLLTGLPLSLLLAAYGFRLLLVWTVAAVALPRLACSDLVKYFPALDILLCLYWGLAVPYFLLRKKPVKWGQRNAL